MFETMLYFVVQLGNTETAYSSCKEEMDGWAYCLLEVQYQFIVIIC